MPQQRVCAANTEIHDDRDLRMNHFCRHHVDVAVGFPASHRVHTAPFRSHEITYVANIRARLKSQGNGGNPFLFFELLRNQGNFAVKDFQSVLPERAQVRIIAEAVEFVGVAQLHALSQSDGYRHLMEVADDRPGVEVVVSDDRMYFLILA